MHHNLVTMNFASTFSASHIQIIAAVLFFMAVLHTFFVHRFQKIAKKYAEGSVLENIFHLLGEVEVVFGLWAALLFVLMVMFGGTKEAIEYLESRNFREPVFVFAVLALCSTRPIMEVAQSLLILVSKVFPLQREVSFYFVLLSIGPILGSLITEPAAMAVSATLLLNHYLIKNVSVECNK